MTVVAGPRVALGIEPTPLVAAHRLQDATGVAAWLKRDDLIGFAQAGTKTRALEFLVADALDGGYDCLVGCGGAGSNFIAALAAAAAVTGLGCHLVLHGRPAQPAHPNVAAARAWGASVGFTNDSEREAVDAAAVALGGRLSGQGFRPYVIPRGGATEVGAMGAAAGVAELAGPLDGEPPARIVVAAGSGTTSAGLLVGLAEQGWPTTVVAAAVSRSVADTRDAIWGLARSCAHRMGIPSPRPASLHVVDAIGPGFGIASPAATAAAGVALRTEGIILDPTYTAKAFAVLLGDSQEGATVFWHTGGIAGALAALVGRDPGPPQ